MLEQAFKLQSDLAESARKVWWAGLGMVAVAREQSSKVFDELVRKGQEVDDAPATSVIGGTVVQARNRMMNTLQQVGTTIDVQVTAALGRMGLPTRTEIALLTRRIEDLNNSLELLRTKTAARNVEKAPEKATARPGTDPHHRT